MDANAEPHGLQPGTLIDRRYRVDVELGRGGMGVVYLATDVDLDRQVALKVLAPALANDARALAGLRQEAKALAAVRSEHVVQIYAFGQHEGACFFAMEYVRGRDLGTIVHEHAGHGARVPLHRALTILDRIAHGLAAVHRGGIVHRDIKPANVVIEVGSGRPVLVDFGLATPDLPGGDATIHGGTPQYMAPEQAGLGPEGSTVTTRTDVYALGCTAFELLTGRPPFQGESAREVLRKHALEAPPKPSSIVPDLGPFDAVLARALAKDPRDRFEGGAAFAAALAEASERWRASDEDTLIVPSTKIDEPGAVDDGVVRILVVDDDPDFAKLAARAAQIAFFRKPVKVETAASGAEALERALRRPPNLVLLDYDMPGLDGADTLSRLRAQPRGAEARVVVVSGRVGRLERWRFSVMGVTDFWGKPIDFKGLVEGIGALADQYGWREITERSSDPG